MTQTTIGGTQRAMTEVEQAALTRRTCLQDYFEANKGTPLLIMSEMVQFGVTVDEANEAMSYKMNADGITRYLRGAGAPDGFMGLKVWPAADIQRYLDWAKSVSGFWGSCITDPVAAQSILDNEEKLTATFSEYRSPWSA